MTLSSATPGLYYDENAELPPHASLTYQDVKAAGPPSEPLDFPTPTVHRALSVSGLAMDHRHGKVYKIEAMTRTDKKIAYLFKKNIAKTAYGCVKLCVVLRRRSHNFDFGTTKTEAEWISTDEMVAIKASSRIKMRQHRRKESEDPWKGSLLILFGILMRKPRDAAIRMLTPLLVVSTIVTEAATLQYVGNYHTNILGCLEILQDDEFLYTISPYCSGGDMYSVIRKGYHINRRHKPPPKQQPAYGPTRNNSDKSLATTATTYSNSSANTIRPDETQARIWFRQLLEALLHLQKKGVCHRDLSLDNILLEANNNLVLIDFGLSLRVPYADNSNYGGVSDVSEGTDRLLIKHQGRNGNLTYLAPEIIEDDEAFDGFAADLWSAGVILFVLLVGLAPFKWPNASTDVRYAQIKRGKLKELMATHLPENTVSDEAIDLLQNMLWRDPRQRLSLAQILQHPWVVGPPEEEDITEQSESSKLTDMETRDDCSPKISPVIAKHTVHFDESSVDSSSPSLHPFLNI